MFVSRGEREAVLRADCMERYGQKSLMQLTMCFGKMQAAKPWNRLPACAPFHPNATERPQPKTNLTGFAG